MNPYLIEPPFYVSFSGGRTSGMMLAKIIEAHGGKLPDGGHALFANTGREHAATYQFVDRMAEHFNVDIKWLEYRAEAKYAVVNTQMASRNGEPFRALIDKRKYLPNPVTRFCTSDLKVKPMTAWMREHVGDEFTCVIGLRYDEPNRVAKLRGDASRDIAMPLADAHVDRAQVMQFWADMPFDLQLPNNDQAFGNCDLCFLKSMAATQRVIAHDPNAARWWIDAEESRSATFRKDRPRYSSILHQVTVQGRLFEEHQNDQTIPCDCTE